MCPPSCPPVNGQGWGATAIQAPQTQLKGVMLLPEQLGLPALIQVCCFSWTLLGTVWDPCRASWALRWECVRKCSPPLDGEKGRVVVGSILRFLDGPEKYLGEENKNSASVLPGEIDDLQDARAPTIAQLLQEKTLYSFSEWPKVRLKGTQFVSKCSWVALTSSDSYSSASCSSARPIGCSGQGVLPKYLCHGDASLPKGFPAELRSPGLGLALILSCHTQVSHSSFSLPPSNSVCRTV